MALAVLLRDPEENPVALSDRPFRTGPAEEGGGAPGRGCQPPPPLTEGLVLLRGEPTATPLRSLRGIFLQPTSGRLSRASLKGLGRGEKNNNWRGGGGGGKEAFVAVVPLARQAPGEGQRPARRRRGAELRRRRR